MTPQMHLHVLASGSKGNACVVEGPQGAILIDCGISRRQLCLRADELGLDLGMLRAAGFAAVVGNGIPAAKAEADAVVAPCLEDGFAEAVERFVLCN